MDINKCIDDVINKFGYEEDLGNALKKCIPVMAEGKSEEEVQIIIDTLQRVPIVIFEKQPTQDMLKNLENEMANGRNSDVKFIDADLGEYGKNIAPGAYTTFPIFDDNMDIVDRVRLYIYYKIR